MTRIFLFDLYGVLIKEHGSAQFERVARAVGEPSKNDKLRAAYESLRLDLDAGRVHELNYWNQVKLLAGLEYLDIQEVIAADYKGLYECDQDMVDYVLSLKSEGHRIGILSNVPEGLAKLVREHNSEWLDQLDAVTLSCDIGAAKPESQAFHIALEALGADPADVTFIDDRLRNIEAAREEGLHAIHFTGLAALKESLQK
nr:HAD family phosphatase [Corynebacterium crudilactis]